MDKKVIKNFAIESRKILIAGVTNKLSKLGITKDGIDPINKIDRELIEYQGNRFSGKNMQKNYDKLVDDLAKREIQTGSHQIAFENLVEEVAYTWFNRIIAIRFMEVNDYLPEGFRVLSSETTGKKEPDIITHLLETTLYSEMDTATRERAERLLMDGSADAVDELYQLVFIKQCNSLNQQLPDLFEKIDDYTELLFTVSYIDENGVIAKLLTIPEADFDVEREGQVEIIGWMYQYYNTEPKDKVFARGNRKIRADEIPAATQLFTPDWIVRYMVENSLGRYYIDQKLANPLETRTEKEIADEFGWKYYLPTAEQPEDVQLQIQAERKEKSDFALQELKLIDPSMGSGHILVYAFDVLMQLYEAEGEMPRVAAELILTQNLFGLDIDKRAFQLAYFALMMKGRQYSRRILSKGVRPNVFAVPDNAGIGEAELQLLHINFPNQEKAEADLLSLTTGFHHGHELGSLIAFDGIDFENLKTGLMGAGVSFIDNAIQEMVFVGELLQQDYNTVITNPPYMGASGFDAALSKFSKKNYPNSKSDLFAIFIERWNHATKELGYNAMVTMQSWMFLSSYESMRKSIINNITITNMMHMENMVMGIAFGTAVSIFHNKYISGFKGTYHQIKTKDISNLPPKKLPIEGNRYNEISQEKFKKIPGSPISYWVSENLIHDYIIGQKLDTFIQPRQGMATTNNNLFLRQWYEVGITKIGFDLTDEYEAEKSQKKWFPYNKGGNYRRWYGNYDYVINFEKNGRKIEKYIDSHSKVKHQGRIINRDKYFKESITWGLITSAGFSMRWRTKGSIFDVAGMSAFSTNSVFLKYVMGVLNSSVGNYIFKITNPTINLQAGDINNFPLIVEKKIVAEIVEKVDENILICQNDWNSFESSWEFLDHPLK